MITVLVTQQCENKVRKDSEEFNVSPMFTAGIFSWNMINVCTNDYHFETHMICTNLLRISLKCYKIHTFNWKKKPGDEKLKDFHSFFRNMFIFAIVKLRRERIGKKTDTRLKKQRLKITQLEMVRFIKVNELKIT